LPLEPNTVTNFSSSATQSHYLGATQVDSFAGGGRTGEKISDLGSAESHTAVGVGFRYMMAKILGLRVARGPEDTYVYLVMGSAWSTGL